MNQNGYADTIILVEMNLIQYVITEFLIIFIIMVHMNTYMTNIKTNNNNNKNGKKHTKKQHDNDGNDTVGICVIKQCCVLCFVFFFMSCC